MANRWAKEAATVVAQVIEVDIEVVTEVAWVAIIKDTRTTGVSPSVMTKATA